MYYMCVTLRDPPVLAWASGMGRLVWVARVLRLVVHVSGRRWAGLTSPASSPRAALLADSSQLALALWDGFGGESQGQLEQVNLGPEGIYLGGRWGGSRRREVGERRTRGGRGWWVGKSQQGRAEEAVIWKRRKDREIVYIYCSWIIESLVFIITSVLNNRFTVFSLC